MKSIKNEQKKIMKEEANEEINGPGIKILKINFNNNKRLNIQKNIKKVKIFIKEIRRSIKR